MSLTRYGQRNTANAVAVATAEVVLGAECVSRIIRKLNNTEIYPSVALRATDYSY